MKFHEPQSSTEISFVHVYLPLSLSHTHTHKIPFTQFVRDYHEGMWQRVAFRKTMWFRVTLLPRKEEKTEIKRNKSVTKEQGTYLSRNTCDETNERSLHRRLLRHCARDVTRVALSVIGRGGATQLRTAAFRLAQTRSRRSRENPYRATDRRRAALIVRDRGFCVA